VSLRDGFIVEAISSSVVETATLGYAFLEVTLFVRILSVISISGTIFEGHHQPLRVWVLCLYLMGLNLSNEQIAAELDLSPGDVQEMTSRLRKGVVDKKSQSN
jgi:hypothetical protein